MKYRASRHCHARIATTERVVDRPRPDGRLTRYRASTVTSTFEQDESQD